MLQLLCLDVDHKWECDGLLACCISHSVGLYIIGLFILEIIWC